MSQLCPCGSGRELAACCGPFLDGSEQADTAERLVRSRYAAYALGNFAYVVETTHPDYREDISIEKLEEQTRGVHWLRLDMGPCQEQVPAGPGGELYDVAEFYAYYELEGVTRQIGERGFFARKDGRLYYMDGEARRPQAYRRVEPKIGRNDPCPCGSGKKYKKCCGAAGQGA